MTNDFESLEDSKNVLEELHKNEQQEAQETKNKQLELGEQEPERTKNTQQEPQKTEDAQQRQREQEAQRTKDLHEKNDYRKRYEDSGSDCSQRRSRSSTTYPRCYYSIKDRVRGRMFMGEYVERRRVKQINEYRDVVAVNPSEIPFLNDLKYVLRCAEKENAPEWLPITAPSSNLKTYRLWVSLPEGTPFDKYWFLVRSVKCFGNQIRIRLKIVRTVVTKDLNEDVSEKRTPDFKMPSVDLKANLIYLVTEVLTASNIVNALRLLLLALTGLVAGLVEFMKHVGMWSIAFTREAGIVVERCTPLALGILNFLSKVFGGAFIFLTMLYRDLRYGKSPPPQRTSYMAIGTGESYYDRGRRR